MESSWQIKCSSGWQTSAHSMPSSSQLPPQGSRNQSGMNAGHYFNPYTEHIPSSTARGVAQERMAFNTPNLASSKSGRLEMAESFLALLSGPPSQFQHDFQSFLSPQSSITASNCSMHDRTLMVNAADRQPPVAPVRSFLHHVENEHMRNGELCSDVRSRQVPCSNSDCLSVLHGNHNLSGVTLESRKTLVNHTVRDDEIQRDLLGWGQLASLNHVNSGKLQTTHIQAPKKISSEVKSAFPGHSSSSTGGYPRVVCMGSSGDLLLSNSGLLGVVCSCHGLHMSISKFCEHSGLFSINPGHAVCMESGEPVAQWRKTYFHKFGFRVLDDHSGWDWPEGFSAAGGLVKCRATLPNISKNSYMFQSVDSNVVARSGSNFNDFMFPKNPLMGRTVLEKSENKVMHEAQLRNAPEGHDVLLKSMMTSYRNLPAQADSQIIKKCPISGALLTSKPVLDVRQKDSCYQSISDCMDVISRGCDSLISIPNSGNLMSLGAYSGANNFNSSKGNCVVDRGDISSKVDLRLGQPSQQNYVLGGSVISSVGTPPFETIGDRQKSHFQDHTIHSTINAGIAAESRPNLWPALFDTLSSNKVEEKCSLNFMQHALGGKDAVDPNKFEQYKSDDAKNSLISMFLPQRNAPSEGNPKSQANNNMVNVNEKIMPRMPYGESHLANCGTDSFQWKRSDGSEWQLCIDGQCLRSHLDKGKEIRCFADGSVSAKSNLVLHNEQVENLSSFNGVISEHSVSGSSMLPEKQFSYLCQLSGLPQDLSDANKSLNHRSGKVSCLESNGNIDHAFHRSINSFPVTAESDFPPPAASIGLSSLASSIYRTKPTPFLSTKEGSDASTHSLDENLRLLALRHVFELSKREHPVSSIDLNPQVGLNGPLGMEMHRKGFIENPSVSEVVRQNPYLNIVQDSTEMAVRSFESCTSQNISGGIKQLAAVAGLKNWCNLSTAAEGISIHSEELGTSDTPSHAPLMDKQYLLRARDENTACLEHEGCYWKDSKPPFLGKCSCAVHSKFIAAKCGSSGRSSFDAYKEIVGSVGEKASNLVSPIFSKGHNIKDVRAVVVDQCGNLNRMTVDPCDAEWRDIPSKGTEIINATCIDNPVELLGSRGNVENQFKDKGFNVTVEDEMLKEQQMSNACSGCSAPAVTEVSVEANNMDSCTVNASNPGYLKGVLVDEGSGIDSWSSDNDFDSCDSAKFINVTHKSDSIKGISSTNLPYKSSRGPVDDLKLKGSFKPKKVRNGRINHRKQVEDLKSEKLKRTKKWERVNAYESHRCTYGTEQHSCSSEEINIPSRSDSQTCGIYSSESSVLKRKRSSLFSLEIHSRKRDGFRLKHQTQWEDDYRTQSKDDMNFVKRPKLLDGKKFKKGWTGDVTKQFMRQEKFQLDGEGAAKHISADKSFSGVQMSKFDKKRRPIVCGKFGIISNGKMTEDPAKPAKIVSLSSVLKIARRCSISGNESPKLASTLGTKEKSFRSKRCYDKPHILKIMRNNEGYNTTLDDEDPGSACIEKNKACFNDKKIFDNNIFTWDKKRVNGGHRKCKILHECSNGQSKIRFKEARQRSLYELSVKGKDSNCAELSKIMQQTPQNKCRAQGKSCLENEEDSKLRMSNLCQLNAKRSTKENECQVLISDLDAFCCVCGSSNKDEINSLLECSRCLIKVHQACYGVSKAPKGRWCCRPCRTNSKNIACVLCGYEGGAMTRAIHSRNLVKSLLKTWNIISETKPMNSVLISGTLQNEFCMLDSSRSMDEADIKSCPETVRGTDLLKELDASKNTNVSPSILQVHNSITAGVHDSTVKQWVHMVCGLWTPGTRCPNVDTMSAFDVSGASQLRKNEICSLCNRPGGSCIQCRVVNCCVQFHPWCAHRKGLLQSEVEGVDSENVGFYGRCLLHATHHRYGPDNHPIDTDIDGAGKRETTCARTEGYKGRKGEGFMHNLRGQTNDNGGCLVPQEQINAWLHINGQKSCSRGLPKPLASDVEYDCRKEYARYKQAKGWKHLVVYKSGIHALGLYTSRFIARGSMVVEYVGEIVGLRVADKRENDYQSGRKLQYKSACYFFRIDKEHIIDATRKGGIARFVNHSCLPNCVAKVISVRNEKKVVFFAERDINLGEEITYDYHFNHEDEGKKIPCFCKSKNCRRYLN